MIQIHCSIITYQITGINLDNNIIWGIAIFIDSDFIFYNENLIETIFPNAWRGSINLIFNSKFIIKFFFDVNNCNREKNSVFYHIDLCMTLMHEKKWYNYIFWKF